jgi:hypothetical protein
LLPSAKGKTEGGTIRKSIIFVAKCYHERVKGQGLS